MGATLSSPTAAPLVQTAFKYGMYALIFSIVMIIILVIIHFTIHPIFSLSPGDLGFIPIPVPSDKQVAFNKAPAGADVSGNFSNVVPCGYTLSMDLYLTGNFSTSTSPRVILYNAPVPVQGTGFTAATLNTAFPRSNLIMWLDPAVNDLYISVITSSAAGAPTKIETTPAIANVPMKTPFRITYVYTQGFLEVYMNGSLENTIAYKNPPIGSSSSSPFFFGQISSRASCLAGNVFYWPRTLTSREVRATGSPVSTPTFFGVV
jgi:hypothetical protein